MSSAAPRPSLIWLEPPPPARRTLSRAAIVAAAIRVADSGGAAGLTMSAVADALGPCSSMALYRYVGSKDGLVDLMLDAVIGEVPLPDPSRVRADWRAALRTLALDSWAMAKRHVWYAQLVHTRPPLGPNTMRRTEAALGVLSAAGLGLPDAFSYFALLDRHVFASAVLAAEQRALAREQGIDDDHGLAIAIHQLHQGVAASGEYPLLSRWMSAPQGLTREQQLERGLDFLLDGIERAIPG